MMFGRASNHTSFLTTAGQLHVEERHQRRAHPPPRQDSRRTTCALPNPHPTHIGADADRAVQTGVGHQPARKNSVRNSHLITTVRFIPRELCFPIPHDLHREGFYQGIVRKNFGFCQKKIISNILLAGACVPLDDLWIARHE